MSFRECACTPTTSDQNCRPPPPAQPLTSPLLPIGTLKRQYTGDAQAGFLRSATFLGEKYSSIRRVRGDGNCYYRAFLYSLCEQLLRGLLLPHGGGGYHREEFRRLRNLVASSLEWVCKYGYDEHTIDMFHEELVGLFDLIEELSFKLPAGVEGGADGGDADGCERVLQSALQRLHDTLNEENAVRHPMCAACIVLTRSQFVHFSLALSYFRPSRCSPFFANLQASDYCTW